MGATKQVRRLQDQYDVLTNGLPHLGVPRFRTDSGSSFVIETIAAGGAGSFSLGASNLGNTLGQTGVTGSRVVLAGIGNVTLSQLTDANGGTISISGGTVAAGAAFSAGVSGGNTSGDTGISGTRVVFAGGNGITLSQATNPSGASITISGAQQSAQTQNVIDLTLGGNAAGVLALVSSGTLTLAGGNNVTLSQNGNAVTISGAAQSVQPETQTFIGGISASDTLFTSGTVRLTGVGGGVTISSNTGQRIDISVAAPVAQTAQTGISSIAASDATYTSGQVQFTGSNMVTVRSSAGQRVVIDATQSEQTQHRFDATISGNTSGALAGISSGTLTIAGGNNITISQAGNAITISGANAAGAQTAISGLANSETTYTSGTVSLSELGAITIRSTTGNQFQFSVNPQSVQPETQTFIAGISASNTLYTSGNVRLTGVGGGVTISSNTGQRVDISVAAQSVQPETQTFIAGVSASDTLYTSGNVRITGVGGGITVSSNTGQRIDLSVAAPVAQTGTQFSAGLSNIGNTLGDTGTVAGRLVLAGGNRITLSGSTNGASETVTISAPDAQTGISSIVGSDATYTSGSVQFTGSGMITVRSSANQRIVIDATQSVQPGVQQIVASNASFSSGTVSISGFGDITVNTAANIIRISGPVQTVESQSIGMSNLGNTSGTTGIASGGAVRFLFAGGNNITLSQSLNGASGTITISAPNAVAQTNQSLGMYAVQNTTGQSSSTTMDARTLSIAGDGAVSVGYSAGSLRISAPVQSVQPETQTFIGGISASDTLYTSGSVRFTGVGGGVTISSNTGQRVDISVAAPVAQTVQTQNVHNVTLSGNTAGAMAQISSGTMTLAGGNNITLSQAGNAVTISGAAGAETQVAISGISASDTLYTSGTVRFTGVGGGITVSSNTGQRVDLSVAAQSVQPGIQNLIASDATFSSGTVSISGFGAVTVNTAANIIRISAPVQTAQTGLSGLANSQTTYTSGTVSLSELGAITIRSTTGNQFQLSVNAQTVESQSIGMSNIGNTSGTTGIASGGQVRFLFAGGNNITLSQSVNGASGTITISAPTQSVQPETQTFIGGISASDTLYTSGTVRITGVGGGITVSSNTGQRVDLSVAAQSVQPGIQHLVVSDTTFSSGTVSLSGFGAATLNTAANIIRVSVPTQTAQTGISGIANSQTTYTSGTVSLSELGAITIRSTTGNQYQLSVNAQTGTQFSAGLSNIGNTAGDTVTVGGRVILAGGNGITLSGSSNGVSQTITISGITQSVESQSIGMSNIGNTSGTTGIASGAQVRFVFAGGNNITLSQSLNGASGTITISAPNLGAGAMSAGVSNLGNTAGSTGVTGTRLVFAGTNNISLSQSTDANGGTISINNTVSAFQMGVSTGGNTAGATGVTGTRVVLVGDSPLSLSQTTGANGATISIDAPATSLLSGVSGISISTNGSTVSIFRDSAYLDRTSFSPYDEAQLVTGQNGHGSLFMAPVHLPDLVYDRIAMGMNFSNASNSSGSITISVNVGIYTQNASTLSLVASASGSTNFSGSGTVGSYSLYGGLRILTIPWTTTLNESDYWMGIITRTTTGGAAGHTLNQLVRSEFTAATLTGWSGIMGAAATATAQFKLGLGIWSATSAGMPASVAFSHITGSGSVAMREPHYYLRSGTV